MNLRLIVLGVLQKAQHSILGRQTKRMIDHEQHCMYFQISC